ncbi:OTU deubiquitinase with linear linkage specificity a [Nematolebias whitei]|uniref:OTU deubiquitinase with linear linkage specificity a n=1 Tax=Nematolebias whitei TaxID=451745 RepID=UPI0018971805|nr:OTU deubiquitinase with linear linkage specificity a [Nematolebias whitei]
MSWVKAVPSSGEDVFDENGDELNLQSKEWTSNMKKRVMDGYVDGVGAGEEASLQVGFNLGFKEGAAQTEAVGRLKGIISAVWCWCQIHHPETPVPASVTDLLHQVTRHEDQIMNRIRQTLENPPPSVSDVSESMDDLEVEQPNSGCSKESCNKPDCCRTGQKMDMDGPHQPQHPFSESSDCSSGQHGGLDLLLQRCMDIVSELGLPQELIGHIQELRNI